MSLNEYISPENVYLDSLAKINEIKFTPREIDIIACLLNARRTSKIASLLSVSPKTVINHIRNIMLKLECNSQEGIIDFIERSRKIPLLRKHYAHLLLNSAFKKSLKEISKLNCKLKVAYKIIYWSDHKAYTQFVLRLEKDLKSAAFNVSVEARDKFTSLQDLISDSQEQAHYIHIVENTEPVDTETSPLLKGQEQPQPLPLQNMSCSHFVFLREKENKGISQEIRNSSYIYITEQDGYFAACFSIMEKLLPQSELEKIKAAFKEQYETVKVYDSPDSSQLPQENEDIGKDKNSFRYKLSEAISTPKWLWLSAFLILCILSLGRLVSYISDDNSIRSDLPIPIDNILLQRSQLKTKIEELFKDQQDIKTVALIGIGGAGKTTLARQFALSQKLPVIWEINAETQESLRSSFEQLAYALSQTDEEKKVLREVQSIKNSEEREKKIIQLVKVYLRLRPDWLLIYDNVKQFNDIHRHFPSDPNIWGKGKIILTTQDSHIQNNNHIHLTIQVGELSHEEKLKLFCKIMYNAPPSSLSKAEKFKHNEQAKEFLDNLSPFPLDVSTAAYYLKATNISYEEYLSRLNESNSEFIEIQENVLKESTGYPKTRYRIVSLSLNDFVHKQNDFVDLLLLISLLDSQNIPRDLLDLYKGGLVVDNFIYNLKKYSLISAPLGKSTTPLSHLSIHLSIQGISLAYLRGFLKLNKDSVLLKQSVSVLEDYVDRVIEQEDFSQMQTMAGHLEKLLNYRDLLTDFSQGLLRSRLGCIYYFLNNDKSRPVLKDSLKNFRVAGLKVLSSEEEVKVARSFLHIGVVYTELRLYKEAQELLEKAAKIYRDGKLKNEVELSWVLSHLGNLYRRQGNYEKAREYLEESVRLNKQYSSDGKRMVRSLSCLGSVYKGLGSYQKSIEILEESLRLCRKYYPEDHFRIGRVLKSLGNLYRRLGDYKQAKKYLENSLLIYKKYFPENHINIGLTLAYLGNCLRELGEFEKSRDYLEQSLKIHREHFHENHPIIGWILFHLARTYKALGKHQESHKLFDKVLEIYDKGSWEENIETACLMRDTAEIYLEKNRLDDAEDFIKRSLNILAHRNHIETYKSLEVLGEIYFKRSLYAKSYKERQDLQNQALNQFTAAIKMIEQHFPKTSSHIQRLHSKIKRLQEERT